MSREFDNKYEKFWNETFNWEYEKQFMEGTISEVIKECKKNINSTPSYQKRFLICLYENGLNKDQRQKCQMTRYLYEKQKCFENFFSNKCDNLQPQKDK